ncbi:alpha/beta fold hydrolase [Oceanicaulis sp. MMSF_3324]|uniref:alpha/beta fold hydrolase n=1 Tax=Oceanicaulis sp. MMSF_3324 TaxID=3046702 RepID=UPI00273F6D52|nr:alpha/beta fold hydrolase [Oceanicaulis sp. MMSF_3324]
MRSGLLSLIPAIALVGAASAEEPITFTSQEGASVDAFQGAFTVPEDRSNPDSRMIEIGYVRFPALDGADGAPIVYLAGGPGGSGTGTARAQRFELFMQMRQHGDVIAFDQRGTGLSSNDLPSCVSHVAVPETEPTTDAEFADAYRQAALECRVFWHEQGVEIDGYTTAQSVEDISDLRAHLGAEQVTLWGISYGTHLAMAALKTIPDEIDRAILASAEGLDQTVKLPSQTEAYIERLQAAVNTQPAAAATYPDIAGLMARVHAKLEAEPMMIQVQTREGVHPFLLQRRDLQQMASGLISDPGFAAIVLAMYAEIDQADSAFIASGIVGRFYELGQPIILRPMSTAMDLASGISEARLTRVEHEARTSLLGAYLNFPMPQLNGVWSGFGLDDDFRAAPVGDTPILLLSGTLDGRTYPDSQREALSGMANVDWVIVENAGHNLFMTTPEVHAVMHRFMAGETVDGERIIAPLPDLTDLPF